MSDGFNRTDVVVLRTGRLHEADMVANHFDEVGIPYYRRVESSSGIEVAIPLLPVQGVGVWWIIRVPQEHADSAKDVINSLPMEATLNPGIWHYGPSKKVRRFIKFSAYISAIFMLVWFILWLTQLISEI